MQRLITYFMYVCLSTTMTFAHTSHINTITPSNTPLSTEPQYDDDSITFEDFAITGEITQLSQVEIMKVLQLSSSFYLDKLDKLGFKRNLSESLEKQDIRIKPYVAGFAKQLNMPEADFMFLFHETERLIRKQHFDADDMLVIKRIIYLCAHIPSKKIETRLTNAGIDPQLQNALFTILSQAFVHAADRVIPDSCCGGHKNRLLDILKPSTQPK
ncbi:MAG: hypothetical protein Q8K36_04230 [Alphaproteobacteria bacterium]|nr:hypothetical protein [Alphaproteobacteria bacterium]